MNYAAVIAEYNPFHNGHAWQLEQARALGARQIAVFMSSGLTQRGSLPLLPEPVRAKAALLSGADLVFALPAPYACAGAELFARAGVALAAAAGCDSLVFGAEDPDPALLMTAATLLAGPDYPAALHRALEQGARNFAQARQMAVENLCPGGAVSRLLDKPNNNLAVEYCKAIVELKAPLTPCPLPRRGAQHGETRPGPADAGFASASALRALWNEGSAGALAAYLPEGVLPFYQEARQAGAFTDPAAESLALLSLLRMRAHQPGGFAGVRGLSEGLEHRLADGVRQAVNLGQLCDLLTTVRYPRARMRRLCMDAALGYGEALPIPPLPPYLHLLGGRRAALGLLGRAALPASPSLAKLARETPACADCARAQGAAADLAALCRSRPAPMGLCFTQKPVLL